MEYKALKISADAYHELAKLKEKMAKEAKKKNDLETLGMLAAMGMGSFMGYLIFRTSREIQKQAS
jgi:hypothetical protein